MEILNEEEMRIILVEAQPAWMKQVMGNGTGQLRMG